MMWDVPISRLDRGFTRNVGALLLGQVVRVPITALYFVIATRALGVESFGRLAAVVALIMITAPFSTLGSGALIVKYGATTPEAARHWLGAGLALTGIGATVVGSLLLLLTPLLVPVGTGLAVVVGLILSELVCAQTADLAASVFVAREQMHVTAFCQVLLPTLRLLAAGILLLSPAPVSLETWVIALVLGSAISVTVCLTLAVRAVGRPRVGLAPLRGHWREGVLFSVGIGVQVGHNDIDKVMLGRLDGPAGAGVYAAAYRAVDLAWLPMRAVLGAAWPRLFRHAHEGPAALLSFMRKVAGPSLLYCVTVVAVIVAGAGVLVPLLGGSFAEAVPLLRVLAVVVLLRYLHYLPADILTGMGRQGVRTVIQVMVLSANVGLNLWLIPRHGVWGAAWATLVSEAALAVSLWVALLVALRRLQHEPLDSRGREA